MESPKVSIVISNFKTTTHLDLSLKEHQENQYQNSEIIVVDSCTPNFENWMKKYENVQYHHSEIHLGPSVSKNIGFQKSDPKSKYVCFMDDDVMVTPNWLDNMVKLMEENQTIGAASPILYEYSDKSQIDSIGHLMTHVGYPYKIAKTKKNLEKLKSQKIMDVFYAETAVVVIRRELLIRLSENMEPFDGDYFIHWYDIDLSWRLWLIGFRVTITSESFCYHDRGISGGAWKLKPHNIFLSTRNRLLTFLKNYEMTYLLKYFPATIVLEFLRAIALLSKRPDHSKATLKAIFWVIFHPNYVMKKRRKYRKPLTKSNDELSNVFVKTKISYLRNEFKKHYD